MDKKRVLVVVDYQKDFVDGALGFDSAASIDAGIASLVQQYIGNGDPVIFTLDTHYENYLDTQEGRKLPVEHCIENTDGWKVYGKTGEVYEQAVQDGKASAVTKETFGSNELLRRLETINGIAYSGTNRIESITLVGVVTNMCVISNAVIAKAACPEAEIIIRSDLVDSFDKDAHAKALELMEKMQMTVTDGQA